MNLGLRKFNCKRVLTCIFLHLSTFSLQCLVKVQAPASPIFFFIDSFPLPFVSSCPGCFSDPVLLAPPGWRWLAHLCLPPGLVLLMPLFKDDHPYTMKIFVCIIMFMLYPSSIAARFLFYFCPSSYMYNTITVHFLCTNNYGIIPLLLQSPLKICIKLYYIENININFFIFFICIMLYSFQNSSL